MKTLIDFDLQGDETAAYSGQEVPHHTRVAIENYLIHGFRPGGFLTSCLTGQLFLAVQSADSSNRIMLWCIVRWIMHHAPEGSWGSHEAMQAWIDDRNGCRTQYREQCERSRAWLTLVK